LHERHLTLSDTIHIVSHHAFT